MAEFVLVETYVEHSYHDNYLMGVYFDGGVFTDNDDDNYSLELVYKVNNDECDEMIFKDTEENKFFHVYYSEDEKGKSVRFISDEHNFVDCFEVIPKTKTIVVFEEVE